MAEKLRQRRQSAGTIQEISSHPEYVERAFRYPIHTSIRFRKSGAHNWHEGSVINISRTGVLFQSDINLPARTLLEMQVVLPHEVPGEPQANVLCWGPIVRFDPNATEQGKTALAAAIARYRFGHD
jgi:hypothetical protein